MIAQSLAKGFQVAAFTLNASKLNGFSKLNIIKGNVLDVTSVASAVELVKPEAIISCIGVHGTSPLKGTMLYSESLAKIGAAIESLASTKRLVCISS